MGFPENQKLAKDINKVNDECANKLKEQLDNMSAKIKAAIDTLAYLKK